MDNTPMNQNPAKKTARVKDEFFQKTGNRKGSTCATINNVQCSERVFCPIYIIPLCSGWGSAKAHIEVCRGTRGQVCDIDLQSVA